MTTNSALRSAPSARAYLGKVEGFGAQPFTVQI
jgi:hypothetical protein